MFWSLISLCAWWSQTNPTAELCLMCLEVQSSSCLSNDFLSVQHTDCGWDMQHTEMYLQGGERWSVLCQCSYRTPHSPPLLLLCSAWRNSSPAGPLFSPLAWKGGHWKPWALFWKHQGGPTLMMAQSDYRGEKWSIECEYTIQYLQYVTEYQANTIVL